MELVEIRLADVENGDELTPDKIAGVTQVR